MIWCVCFAGDTVCDLFRIQGTLNQHGYHNILQRYTIPYGLRLVALAFVFSRTMTQHTSRLCKAYFTKKESDRVLHQLTWPPPSHDLNPIEMVWDESVSRVKAANKCSAYVGTPSRLLEKHSRWSWLRECQEVQSCHQGKGWLFEESQIENILWFV